MTDTQLAILLRQFHARLADELRRVESQLPDDMAQLRKNFLFPNQPSTYYPATLDLWAVVDELNTSAERLEKAAAA